MNAITRGGIGAPVRIQPQDFEVYRTELQTQSSTVLMLDMSRSMLLRGCYLAAKKVALALNHLIRTQFPRDTIYIIGFSAYARELKAEVLPQLDWSEYEYGTNLHHALLLARHQFPQAPYRGRPRTFQHHSAIQAPDNLGEARPLALNVKGSKGVTERA